MFGEVTVIQKEGDNRLWFIVDEIYEKLGYKQAKDLYTKADNEETSNFVLTENGKRGNGARDKRTIISFDELITSLLIHRMK